MQPVPLSDLVLDLVDIREIASTGQERSYYLGLIYAKIARRQGITVEEAMKRYGQANDCYSAAARMGQ